MPGALAGTDFSRLLNGPSEKEQFFGNGGFSGIGMTDNGKGTAFLNFYLVTQFHEV
jgi:hypothetical protein